MTATTRILVSALSARSGGGRTYIRNIVRHFPAGAGARLSILSPRQIQGLFERADVEWIEAPAWTVRPIGRFLIGALYFRFLWSRRNDFDAVYYAGGSFDVPLPPRVKTIVAFRNMLPFDAEARRRYRFGWTRFRSWLLRFVQSQAFRRADLVIFVSHYGRAVIDNAVPQRRARGVVVPHGVEHVVVPLAPDLANRLPERFILYLSKIDAYKAQVEAVEAWSLVAREGPSSLKLVLAGPEYPPYARRVRAAINRNGLQDKVIILGPVHHDQVFDLAGRAAVNLFLSSCENCPHILLELLSAGRPMLVSNHPVVRELGGADLAYVDPYDVPALALAISRMTGDLEASQWHGEAAQRRALQFSWSRAGRETWGAINAAAAVAAFAQA